MSGLVEQRINGEVCDELNYLHTPLHINDLYLALYKMIIFLFIPVLVLRIHVICRSMQKTLNHKNPLHETKIPS